MKSKRLSKEEWDEEIALEIGKMPMSEIARKHGISRTALYGYAQRHKWIDKKTGRWGKIKKFMKFAFLGK